VIPDIVLAKYHNAILTTQLIEAARMTDRLVGGHRYITEWWLDNHEKIRWAFAQIAEIEQQAAEKGLLEELRKQAGIAPAFLTSEERSWINDWSAQSGLTLEGIPETIIEKEN
jgi:hypothetical protein